MSFDWTEYFYLAQELAGEGKNPVGEEARFRAAISRAYYAAFCKARNHLRDKDHNATIPPENVHRYVRTQFQKSQNRERKKIGGNLARLLAERRRADYDDVYVNLIVQMRYSILLAEQILSDLSNLPG